MTETILLVGGGGREHAIARALADDCDLYACAGNRNPGIADLADGFTTIDETDTEAVVDYGETIGATAAIIGPEAPLEAGLADELDAADIYAFGPHADEARIETDKAWQREFMQSNDVPGWPDFEVFDDVDAACEYVDDYDGDVAVKPTGLTGGKGVRVTGDQLTKAKATDYMRESEWEEWVVEERLVGEEFTIQALVANGDVRTTPAVQDHKRAYEGDEGPNTGGMGSYSDTTDELPFMDISEYEEAVSIIDAAVDALPGYKGVLYGQFMLTADGIKVVEFNARFGDPEAMNTLPVMDTSLLDVIVAAREGDPLPELEFSDKATVCKYGVPEGYPTDPSAGTKLSIDQESVADAVETWGGEALLYYASVDEREDEIYTTTSRSFAVVGVSETLHAASTLAEDALSVAPDEGVRLREDIGSAVLIQERIEHAEELREE
jgi:phosphoribosylamine--glycine ligase